MKTSTHYLPTFVTAMLLVLSNTAYAEFNPICHTKTTKSVVTRDPGSPPRGTKKDVDIITHRKASLDVKRPTNPKIGKEATYDASTSTTPSGQITYKWTPEMGQTQIIGADNQATLKVIVTATPPNKSAKSYINAAIYDPICKIGANARIEVDYYPE